MVGNDLCARHDWETAIDKAICNQMTRCGFFLAIIPNSEGHIQVLLRSEQTSTSINSDLLDRRVYVQRSFQATASESKDLASVEGGK